MLPVACRSRPSSRLRIVRTKQVQQVRLPQTSGAISLAVLVDQQREHDAGFFPELAGVIAIAEPDSRQRRTTFPELALVFTQLRDMLAAENSAIVAEENDHGQVALPQRAEPHEMAVCIGQRDSREHFAERLCHGYLRGCTTTPSRISSVGFTMMVCPSDKPASTSISGP